MSHAPIHPNELRGRFNLHGHVHQNSITLPDGSLDDRYINCCVEMSYGIPQSLDKLYETYLPRRMELKAAYEAANGKWWEKKGTEHAIETQDNGSVVQDQSGQADKSGDSQA